MARPLRLNFPGGVYHVTARGNEKRAIVRNDRDRALFVDTLARVVGQYRVVCHAWVLMINHYHLLLETPHPNLSHAIRQLNGIYSQAFNRRHRRVGHLFQGRFKAIVVEKQSHLLELCRYLVLNPVRARMVGCPQEYAWSSYRATAGLTPVPSWLTVNWTLAQFASRYQSPQQAYRAFVQEGLTTPKAPWKNVAGQIVFGTDAFIKQVQQYVRRHGDQEIPHRQREPVWLTGDDVLHRVAHSYHLRIEDLARPSPRPCEARQVALYGLRREAGQSLTVIARRMGLRYGSVSRRVQAVAARLATDPRFRQRVNAALGVKRET